MLDYSTQNAEEGGKVLLDLFSTSQKVAKKCVNRAPYICIPPKANRCGRLYQACCNDWLCPRCGHLRAKHEYGRMVEGARSLADRYPLYFLTLTCRGDLSVTEAENAYLAATNRFLSAYRHQVKAADGYWCYASVTERQRRGSPHSHYMVCAAPVDAFSPVDAYQEYTASVRRVNEKIPVPMRFTATPEDDLSLLDLHSEWAMLQAVKSGLGVQCRLSYVDTVEGCSRYIAKYLFKESMSTYWPKGWRRVRYSRNWPKLPEQENVSGFPVLSAGDWRRVSGLEGTIETYDAQVYERALLWECVNVVCRVPNHIDMPEEVGNVFSTKS